MTFFSSAEISFERRGVAGVVTLNRPQALNALTLDMVRRMTAQLAAWRDDGAVGRVIVAATGDRAFCAGGDIRWLYERAQAGHIDEALAFWREEYLLDALIKRYPKPYVALIDGVVMGGGVGVSVHGSHRVAGDKYLFAMPEVSIGFFPDVGATWFLPRLPGELGTYCALAGARLRADDAVSAGVATHRVASGRFGELADALAGPAPVDAILADVAQPAAPGPVMARREAIDRLFAGDRVEDILAGLDAEIGEAAAWARETAASLRAMAPLSLKVALAQMRRGRGWSFGECLSAEYRLVTRFARGTDFFEGIRAVIIDKDNRPKWHPASLDGVDETEVARHFGPVDNELGLS